MRTVETVVSVDSFNRDTCAGSEADGFVIDLKGRYDVQTIALGSLEMPHSQYLIEQEWSTALYDVGVSAPPSLSQRTLALTTGLEVANVVVLPAAALTCTLLATSAASAQWMTAEPHGLTAAMILEGVLSAGVLCDVPQTYLPPPRPYVVRDVPGPSLVVTDPVGTNNVGVGCLLPTSGGVRGFATPQQLADVASLNLQAAGVPLKMRYSCEAMALELDYTAAMSTTAYPPPYELDYTAAMSTTPYPPPYGRCFGGDAAPAETLGVQSSPQATVLQFLNFANIQSACFSFPWRGGAFPCQGTFSIALPPGNYSEGLLRTALEMQLNSARAGQLSAGQMGLSVLVPDGPAALTVSVTEYDGVTPYQVAAQLTAAISGTATSLGPTLPVGQRITVAYVTDNHFELSCAYPFAVTWVQDAALQEQLYQRLGFEGDPLGYAPLHVGSPQTWSYAQPVSVLLPMSNRGQSLASLQTYVFKPVPRVQRWPPTPAATFFVPIAQEGGLLFSEALVPLEYLMCLQFTTASGGVALAFAVASSFGPPPQPPPGLVSAYSSHVVYYSLVAGSAPLPSTTPFFLALPLLVSGGAVNFYFPAPRARSAWSRLAEILGFAQGANLWPSPWEGPLAEKVLLTPSRWTFEGPQYVLVDLGPALLSANMVQRCREDIRSTLFGKVLLRPSFSCERYYPIQKSSSGVVVLSELTIAILNPWHEPYHFHGKNWSCTLVFNVARGVVPSTA